MGKKSVDLSLLIGRILISLIFVVALIGKLADPKATMDFMAAYGLVAVGFFFAVAVIVETLGSISLILGYKVRCGAWLLFILLAVSTLIFYLDLYDPFQQLQFFKNLAILGALLILAEAGAGSPSLDRTRSAAPLKMAQAPKKPASKPQKSQKKMKAAKKAAKKRKK